MTRISASKARSDLAEVLNRVAYKGDRVLLHRRGKNVAAVVSIEDYALLEKLEDRMDLADARAAMKEARKKGTIPWEEIKADLGL